MEKTKKEQKIEEIEKEINTLERTGESVGFTARASARLGKLYKDLEELKK